MSSTVTANDGTQLPIDSLPLFFTYSAGFVSSITTYYANRAFVQNFSNDGTNITYISQWQSQTPPVPGAKQMVTEAGDVMITEQGAVMYTEGS